VEHRAVEEKESFESKPSLTWKRKEV